MKMTFREETHYKINHYSPTKKLSVGQFLETTFGVTNNPQIYLEVKG
ncbi:MAG: hypothetical protein GX102_03345 [Porphyromonadaceae bacterium]|nr:hypothetical protein [Porphyromonadaceae bacterium]